MRVLLLNIVFVLVSGAISSVPSSAWYYYEKPADHTSGSLPAAVHGSLNIGSVIAHLPDGAKSVVIDETQYFYIEDYWFLPVTTEGIQYMVVSPPS